MDLKQERKRKNPENKKLIQRKDLKQTMKRWKKLSMQKKKKSYQYIVNKYIDCIFCFFVFLIESN